MDLVVHAAARIAAALLLAVTSTPVGAQTASTGSGTSHPPVLVTGDSIPHQAADDIARTLAAIGYDDVRFAVYGGTTIGWSTDRLLEDDAPIVVFASGTYSAILGWTASDEEEARRAVDALRDRRCAIWVLPAPARYPGGVRHPDQASRDTVAGIRGAVTGTGVHLAEWDLVADALPEIHVGDGVHQDDGGQDLYGWLVAGTVRHRCEAPDAARVRSSQRYVDWATATLLGRAATSEERAAWTDRLAALHPRHAYTRTLTASPEWAGTQIDDLYRRALGREAEPDGRAYWRRLVVDGLPLDAVAAQVLGSDEFLARSGGTRRGFVTALYRQILHREPDAVGSADWQQRLADGTTRPTVAAAFYASSESRGDRVDSLYRSILGRDPDPAGRAAWADTLLRMTDLRVAALLAASPEAFERAQQAG